MYEIQNEGLDHFENPFTSWANNIYNSSKSLVQEGSGINPLFIPTLVPILIKIMKLLPLWSGVMVPIFGYGDDISSSAAIESSFKKLKTITFKYTPLPTDLETFLTNHIDSLKGATLLRSARNNNDYSSPLANKNQDIINENGHSPPPYEMQAISSTSNKIDDNINEHQSQYETEENTVRSAYQSPISDFNDKNEGSPQKSYILKHTPDDLFKVTDDENEDTHSSLFCVMKENQIQFVPIENIENNEEHNARENWNRKSARQRKSTSYLLPNPHLRLLNITNTHKNQRSIPILKNGSCFKQLKSTTCTNKQGKVILSNTCAFDSLTFLIMVCNFSNLKLSIRLFYKFFCSILKKVRLFLQIVCRILIITK